LACRNHIAELVVGAAFELTSDASTSPEMLLYKRFRKHWKDIDQKNFKPASTHDLALVASAREDIINFARVHLEVKQPRDDYREFLELSVIFLGVIPECGVRFQVAGAMHHARWIAKVIYAIKIWLFRDQFRMAASEKRGIRDLATFAVIIHFKTWITVPTGAEAPLNNFRLMVELLKYPHEAISRATSKMLGRHLWYLSEELVGLAIFDPRASLKKKRLMLAAMEDPAPDHPPKRPEVNSAAFLSTLGLEQFCTKNTKRLFSTLGLSQISTFLAMDPSEWDEEETLQEALRIINGLAVVNDRAERDVALIQEFNKKLTSG